MPKAKSWREHKADCEAVAKEGITLTGFVEPWNGTRTKLISFCQKHGEWKTTSIRDFKSGVSCPKCKSENSAAYAKLLFTGRRSRLKEDSFHIEKFMKTGVFHPDIRFFRSERLDNKGSKNYWYYTCPICSNDEYFKAGLCSGVFESSTCHLQRGGLACRCSKSYRYTKKQWEYRLRKECEERGYKFVGWKTEKFIRCGKFNYECTAHGIQIITINEFLQGRGCSKCAGKNQKECYVNFVYDKNRPVALKFGIANNSIIRLKRQNTENMFKMKQFSIYEFHTVENCKAAERTCLKELECGILNNRELKDGWTETTSIQNLDKITEIYERFGGVRIK